MKHWPYSKRRIWMELAVILLINLASFWLFSDLDLFEKLDAWFHHHPESQMDELMLLSFTLAISMSVFAVRRLREARVLLKALHRQAERDDVTGLANRRRGNRMLLKETERSLRSGRAYSVLLIDLDHFKSINDQHGHLIGDQVLHNFGQVLQHRARQLDTVARWGGEEFIVICPETSQEGALSFADDILRMLAATCFVPVAQVTASIGVATYRDDDTPDSLVHRADSYLYAAKQSGRNRALGELHGEAAFSTTPYKKAG
ncbi:GGDEF domain-containing protein [Chromobacterium sp. IIBBL 290-4]|uniref:GGDEF domain-containing protein n=1 Tax=Chromobacterium sp. IIBBL 290-4 TaxID=2953890 RepID=UPI0020B69D14|nr:GGDEF domain-containing protein [Chromobacterium sp. IIBBL 290-4]UTH76505.1 GGDEF domain-containing protein [Chromobacterium sp. IIBBL 290-4]